MCACFHHHRRLEAAFILDECGCHFVFLWWLKFLSIHPQKEKHATCLQESFHLRHFFCYFFVLLTFLAIFSGDLLGISATAKRRWFLFSHFVFPQVQNTIFKFVEERHCHHWFGFSSRLNKQNPKLPPREPGLWLATAMPRFSHSLGFWIWNICGTSRCLPMSANFPTSFWSTYLFSCLLISFSSSCISASTCSGCFWVSTCVGHISAACRMSLWNAIQTKWTNYTPTQKVWTPV